MEWLYCLIIAILQWEVNAVEMRLVEIDQGPVVGYKNDEYNIFEFQGIPYATVPTGVDRFKAALPPPTWDTPLEAVDNGIVCPQNVSKYSEGKTIQEDCLIANIYVPNTNKTDLSVVVYIHGSAYMRGYGNVKLPRHFMEKENMVIVTFNYRIGALGFLCLGTPNIPGNAGLKDQVMLLRWVQRNIDSFGGNPKDVTLAGYSTGSNSADLMLLSKMTNGLFHKVVLDSIGSTAGYCIQDDPLETAKASAIQLNFTNVDDICELEQFYHNAPYELLVTLNRIASDKSSLVFAPCVEKDVGQEIFLHDVPVEILKSGDYMKLPTLIGFTLMEGLNQISQFDDRIKRMNTNFSNFLPHDLVFNTREEKESIAKKVKDFYFGDGEITTESILSYVKYYTHVVYAYSVLRTVDYKVKAGNNQIYLYHYLFADNSSADIVPYTNKLGVGHVYQTIAVMDGINDTISDERGISMKYRSYKAVMRDIWNHFILTGYPVPERSNVPAWPTVKQGLRPHMVLNETIELGGALLLKYKVFWDSIYNEYYRPPLRPSTSTSSCNENVKEKFDVGPAPCTLYQTKENNK